MSTRWSFPVCQGINVRPSGHFPSDWIRPCGSLVTRIPAKAKLWAVWSFKSWSLLVDLGQIIISVRVLVVAVSESMASGRASVGLEAVRETINAEIATLISQNESSPHYFVDILRQLRMLSTDFLRQRGLSALQDVVASSVFKVCCCADMFISHLNIRSP